MDKIATIKLVAQAVVGTGAGKIVKDIIKANTNAESKVDVVTYAAGSIALGGIVAEASKDYVGKKIDGLVESVEKAKAKAREKAEEKDIDVNEAIADAVEKLNLMPENIEEGKRLLNEKVAEIRKTIGRNQDSE